MLNLTIISAIRSLALRLPIGSSDYFDCPFCNRQRKMGITNNQDGIIYHCFSTSCRVEHNSKGTLKVTLGRETLSRILNKKPVEQPKAPFVLPDYLITGYGSEAAISFALKHGLLEQYRKGIYKTATDPRLNRQVFYHYDLKGNVVGAMGRALGKEFPKAHIYTGSEKTPIVFGSEHRVGILVEDVLSALKVEQAGYTGIALSGTSLRMEDVDFIKGYYTLVVALDKDASSKAFALKSFLDLYCHQCIIMLLDEDFKDMPKERVATKIEEVLS